MSTLVRHFLLYTILYIYISCVNFGASFPILSLIQFGTVLLCLRPQNLSWYLFHSLPYYNLTLQNPMENIDFFKKIDVCQGPIKI